MNKEDNSPRCVGCDKVLRFHKRTTTGHFCTQRCAAAWAEAMSEGLTWCEEHQEWYDEKCASCEM